MSGCCGPLLPVLVPFRVLLGSAARSCFVSSFQARKRPSLAELGRVGIVPWPTPTGTFFVIFSSALQHDRSTPTRCTPRARQRGGSWSELGPPLPGLVWCRRLG